MLVNIDQKTAIIIDGNNLERSIREKYNNPLAHPNLDTIVPDILKNRSLCHLTYFREGKNISDALRRRIQLNFLGSTEVCGKSADIPIAVRCMELIDKVNTVIVISGDSDFIYLFRHLRSRGIRIEVAAYKECISNKIYDEVDSYTHLDDNHMWILKPNKNER